MGVADTTGLVPPPAAPGASVARTLDGIVELGLGSAAVRKCDLVCGDQVIVRTRNSVYSLWVIGDGTFAVTGGWFDRQQVSPAMVAINGCTYGGSVIRHDIVAAPGLFLEFGNNVSTTRIRHVTVVRHGAGPGEPGATPLC